MKRKILSLFILSLYLQSFSQNLPSNLISISEAKGSISITFNLPDYTTRDTSVLNPYGISEIFKYITLSYSKYFGNINDIGYPELPQLTFDLWVPNGSTDFQITSSGQNIETITINRRFLPTQDDYEIQPTFQINNSYYSSSGGLYNFISQISDPYVAFGEEGLSISIFPFTYNPQSNTIQVLKQATFSISYSEGGQKGTKSGSSSWIKDSYLSNFFENYPASQSKSTSDVGGKYLMITTPNYENTLTTFANYKRNYGYDVTVVNTNTTGTTYSEILDYIQTLYDNVSTRPDFILLVGDHQDIPASGGNTSGNDIDNPITDLNYARLDGSDFFADVFLGRFSISSTVELQNLINKCIYMEQSMPTFTKKAKFLAGQESNNWMENQFENGHDYVIKNTFAPEGYFYQKLYQPTTSQAVAAINDNPIFYIYSGHGSITAMAGGSFTINSSNINSALNTVYPFVFSFACLTGNFASSSTCIGESWIRNVRGGVSYFGSSVNSMVNSDKAIEKKIFGDAFNDEEQLSPIINLGMKRYWGRFWSWLNRGRTRRYMKAYNLLGDPSLNILGLNCLYDITFVDEEVFESGTTVTYHASHNIINNSTFEIMNGANITLLAGNSITLNSGFKVNAGGLFEARIESCDGGSSSKSDKQNEDTFKSLPLIEDYLFPIETIVQENEIIEETTPFSIYPNPTNSDFTICYSIDKEQIVKIDIFDISGKKIKTLMNLNHQEDGNYSFNFSINDLDKGVYLIVYNTNKKRISWKMIKN